MIYTEQTKKALALCFEAHKEQKDKSGLPYVFHPFHLAEQMTDEDTVTAALLHDVAEDTDITVDDMNRYLGRCSGGEVWLMAHNPLHGRIYAEWGADYTFSGHVHGGAVRLEYPCNSKARNGADKLLGIGDRG